MTDITRAYEIEYGVIPNPDSGGPFITGGSASPIGLALDISTIYIQTFSTGIRIWKKFDTGNSDWRQISAQDIPFDPSSVDLVGTNSQLAIEELANRHYGKDFIELTKEASETTTGGSFTTYSTLTFNVSDSSGSNKYRLNASFNWGHNAASNDIRIRTRIDGTNIDELRIEPKDAGTDQRFQNNIVSYEVNLSQGNHVFDIQYRPATASRVSRMYRSVLEVWRVE